MVFSSPVFLFLFLPLCIITYFIVSIFKNQKANNICLLIFSIMFYAYGSFDFLPILLISIVINYYLSQTYSRLRIKKKKKLYFIISIVFNVLLLFVYKYLNLFSGLLLGVEHATKIRLPIGISFYTFQVISYHIDVYRKTVKRSDSVIDFSLFTMLFPQLIAGPIVRYSDIVDRLKKRTTNLDNVSSGLIRFMVGFSKKILFANALGNIADIAFGNLDKFVLGFVLSVFCIICYTIQIYLDFSAYSDMAIGIGMIFGFEFPENFNQPFSSRSLTEFWKRWHITLSSFFSDYVYKPLGGSRKGLFRTCINLIIVFALSGFWHGANFNYLIWGLYNGLFLVIERVITTKTKFRFDKPILLIYANIVWVIGMILFRFDNFNTFLLYINGLFSVPKLNYNTRWLLQEIFNPYFYACFIISILYLTPFFDKIYSTFLKTRLGTVVIYVVVILTFVYGIMEMLTNGFNPFIYFRF